jgi:hypothetical protein
VTLHAADAAEVARGLGTTRAAGVLTAALGPMIVAGTVSAERAAPPVQLEGGAANPPPAQATLGS